ncbi:class I SAM-dependent methyltransferase [Bradyrhizobium sp. RDI18]|uniref:class I SAM-dependent methyltransferase n=1 Tax=Bradyrhizobium sp. RDI18 TaxID=3367400 RepID=UPI003722E443
MGDITTRQYVLGHSDMELRRLATQSAFWGELTEEVFRRAGISAGMHVLDIGSGTGDVAFLAARLVGPSGSVLGIDRSEEAVKQASARAAAEGVGWCRFSVADAGAFETDQRFDAIVGRLVLMYFPDPASTLRSLVRHLNPGGLVAFQEIVMNSIRLSVPPVPLTGSRRGMGDRGIQAGRCASGHGAQTGCHVLSGRVAAARDLRGGPPGRRP